MPPIKTKVNWIRKRIERLLEDIQAVGCEAIIWRELEHEEDPHGYRGMHFLVESLFLALEQEHPGIGEGVGFDDISKAITVLGEGTSPAEEGAIATVIVAMTLGHGDAYRDRLRDQAFEHGITGDLADPAVQAQILQAAFSI